MSTLIGGLIPFLIIVAIIAIMVIPGLIYSRKLRG